MKNLIAKLFITISIALSLMLGLVYLTPQNKILAATEAQKAVCQGAGLDSSAADCNTTSGPDINGIIKLVINILSVIVGITAVVMIIIAGFKFITSGGDANSVASAKNTILYAVVGLIIVAFAQIIVQFVLRKTQEKPVTNKTTMIQTVEISKEFMV